MSKNLLMLGFPRSEYSLGKCIEEAENMGINLYIADSLENLSELQRKGIMQDKNQIFPLNLSNLDECLNIIKKYNFDNIFSLTEFHLENAARLRELANLTGNSMIAVRSTRDKYLTRVTLDQAGLPNIRHKKCRGFMEVKKFMDDEEQRSMIVKPLDMVGSVGVFKIKTLKDLKLVEKYYKSHKFLQNKQEFLVEEYISGKEISVEGFVNQGEFIPFCITDKFTTGEPYFLEIGHRLPSIHMNDPKITQKVFEYISNCIKALGITQDPIHAELKLTAKGKILIEIHTRYGGDYITQLLYDAFSLNIYEVYYKALLQMEIRIPEIKHKKIVGIEFLSYPEGKIEEIIINNDLKDLEEIISIQFNKKAGDIIECFPHRLERIGQILYLGQSYDQMEYIRNLIKKNIKVKIT